MLTDSMSIGCLDRQIGGRAVYRSAAGSTGSSLDRRGEGGVSGWGRHQQIGLKEESHEGWASAACSSASRACFWCDALLGGGMQAWARRSQVRVDGEVRSVCGGLLRSVSENCQAMNLMEKMSIRS